MSTTNNNSKNRYSVSNTGEGIGGRGRGVKFCKICKDIGKTHAEFTSHFVRETPNPNSRVVCPVLLSSICRYCREGGHTVKHCPKIESKKSQEGVKITWEHSKENKPTVHVNNFSALADIDIVSDDEDEIVITPPTKNTVSYASVLQKEQPSKTNVRSQVESLIPMQLNFSGYNIVTLENITKRWADEEDPDDCEILYTTVIPPIPFDENHSLSCFVSFIDVLVSDYTNNFTKSIAITSDAFHQLSKNWETKFFDINGGRDTFDELTATNTRMRSIIMTERYIQ